MCVCVCVRERERERERDVLCFVCRCEDVKLIHQILHFDLTFYRFILCLNQKSLSKDYKMSVWMSHSHNNNNME